MTKPERIGAKKALEALPLWSEAAGRDAITRSLKFATFAEAFSSVAWAATAAVAAGPSVFALIPMAVALSILLGIWVVRPRAA